jgi:hypothetical protein
MIRRVDVSEHVAVDYFEYIYKRWFATRGFHFNVKIVATLQIHSVCDGDVTIRRERERLLESRIDFEVGAKRRAARSIPSGRAFGVRGRSARLVGGARGSWRYRRANTFEVLPSRACACHGHKHK